MARNQAFDDAVDSGRGHYIVKLDWDNELGMNKKIIVEPIQDPFRVYMDINREKPDYSDCKFGFVLHTQRRKEFKAEHPDATSSTWTGTSSHKWSTVDRVTFAEYYCMKIKKRKLLAIEGYGDDGEEGAVKFIYNDELQRELHAHEKIIRTREVEEPEWWWYKITSSEILDRELLPFKFIPIITTIGKESLVDGQLVLKGLIRDIRDPLTLYNYVASQEAELIALSPRSPWVMAEGQDEGYENMWANANRANHSTLLYKPTTFEGHLVPAPQRTQFSGVPQGLVNQRHEIIEDCKAITGIYDASIGNRSNETSGIAIRARQAQGENSNFHYTLNASYSVNHEGRVIDSALASVYDTRRTITIMGEDDEEEMIEILNDPEDPGLGVGNYNVTVSTGPSSDTSRQEQASGMMELISQVQLVQNVAADVVVRTQDWKGKDVLADRLEYAIEKQFPGITTQQKPKDGNEQLMVLQQQLQQAQQQMQQAQQQMQQMQQALEKSQADKNSAEAQKQQNAMQALQIKSAELKLKETEIMGDLQIKNRHIEIDIMKADLDSETKTMINKNQLEVELIKTVYTPKESKQASQHIDRHQPLQKPPIVNVYNGGKKVSNITKTSEGNYRVETTQ